MAEVNALVAHLREVSIDPFSIQVTDEIDVEIKPSIEGNRVTVGRKGWGDASVNFTHEGLILDVYTSADPMKLLHTACIYADDFPQEDEPAEVQNKSMVDVHEGYLQVDGTRIEFSFAVPEGATEQVKDAAALAAIAQQAELNYLSIGSHAADDADPVVDFALERLAEGESPMSKFKIPGALYFTLQFEGDEVILNRALILKVEARCKDELVLWEELTTTEVWPRQALRSRFTEKQWQQAAKAELTHKNLTDWQDEQLANLPLAKEAVSH